jgi:cbb3-type cytochrome oxidase subunit 3
MRGLLPHLDSGVLGVLSTPLMLLLFIALVCWAYSRQRRDVYNHLERLPLEDGEPEDKN